MLRFSLLRTCLVFLVFPLRVFSAVDDLLLSGDIHSRDPLSVEKQGNFTPWYVDQQAHSETQQLQFLQGRETITAEFYRQLGEFALQRAGGFNSFLELGCGDGEAARRVVPVARKSVLVDKDVSKCRTSSESRGFLVEGDLYKSTTGEGVWTSIRNNGPYDFILVNAVHLRDRVFSDIVNVLEVVLHWKKISMSLSTPVEILFADYGNTKNRGEPGRPDPGVREAVDYFREACILQNCRGFGFYYPLATKPSESIEKPRPRENIEINPRQQRELQNGYLGDMDRWVEGWEGLLCEIEVKQLMKDDKPEASRRLFLNWRLQALRARPITYLVSHSVTGYPLNLDFGGEPCGSGAAMIESPTTSCPSYVQEGEFTPVRVRQEEDPNQFYFMWNGERDRERKKAAEAAGFDYIFILNHEKQLGARIDHQNLRKVELYDLHTGDHFGRAIDIQILHQIVGR
ncbi:unnamed protein product [Amoebophrya sp. A25]|nr:unnamed protein product [Amoebophrya sp. A25]|eukprot:GSA25T00015040001.1